MGANEQPVLAPGRQAEIDQIVAAAQRAASSFRELDQAAVDRIVLAMVKAGIRAAADLALLAFEETGFGVVEDKMVKNYVATEFLWDYLKDKRSVGVIEEDVDRNIVYVADPIGVVLAITPITNPTSTVLFKAIVAAKTRNAIVFRPSPYAVRCAERAVEVLRAAGEKQGLPPAAIQVIPDPAREVTHYLFRHPGIDFTWTTGGPKIVRLANESGKPGISVGPGNAPIYLHRTADIRGAVVDILISKTFDASVICPAEQTCVVDRDIYDAVVAEFERMGAQLLTKKQVAQLSEFAFGGDDKMQLEAVGLSAPELARRAGLRGRSGDQGADRTAACRSRSARPPPPHQREADAGARPGPGGVRAARHRGVRARDRTRRTRAHVRDLRRGRRGDRPLCAGPADRPDPGQRAHRGRCARGRLQLADPHAVARLRHVGRLEHHGQRQLPQPAEYQDRLPPADAAPVVPRAVEHVLQRRCPRQPARCRHGGGRHRHRRADRGARSRQRGTDAAAGKAGTGVLRGGAGAGPGGRAQGARPARSGPGRTSSWPSAGARCSTRPRPCGCSTSIPDLDFDDLALPFLDARKRVANYPQAPHSVRLVAVPTTSGTGSEVSPAAVITAGDRKATLVDYSLVPDTAIVDPLLTVSMPPAITADTGIDALTHALEATVSIFSSPYSQAFSAQAAALIFEALPRAYDDGDDLEARTMMANAATLAGLAFSNAFVGVNHALAHAVGARFGLAHGRANGIFLPHVLRYNTAVPSKFMPAPGYSSYVAPVKYAQLGRVIFGGRTEEESRRRLFTAVEDLLDHLHMPRTLKDTGLAEEEFLGSLNEVTMAAFTDLSIRTNPRMPLLNEVTGLLRAGYYGAA